jgi:hypothetical protein
LKIYLDHTLPGTEATKSMSVRSSAVFLGFRFLMALRSALFNRVLPRKAVLDCPIKKRPDIYDKIPDGLVRDATALLRENEGFHIARLRCGNQCLLAEMRRNPSGEIPAQRIDAMVRALRNAINQVCDAESDLGRTGVFPRVFRMDSNFMRFPRCRFNLRGCGFWRF